jgi:hypothetical protein
VHPAVRLLGVFACLGIVVGMGVYYSTAEADHWPYPGTDDLAVDYDEYVGEETFISGSVRTHDDAGTMLLKVNSDYGPFEMVVTGAEETTVPGGIVQVYGTLRPNRTITASNVVVVNESAGSEWYKYAVSVVGAVLVLVAFFRRWRFAAEALGFEVRTDG